VTMLYTDEEVD